MVILARVLDVLISSMFSIRQACHTLWLVWLYVIISGGWVGIILGVWCMLSAFGRAIVFPWNSRVPYCEALYHRPSTVQGPPCCRWLGLWLVRCPHPRLLRQMVGICVGDSLVPMYNVLGRAVVVNYICELWSNFLFVLQRPEVQVIFRFSQEWRVSTALTFIYGRKI